MKLLLKWLQVFYHYKDYFRKDMFSFIWLVTHSLFLNILSIALET